MEKNMKYREFLEKISESVSGFMGKDVRVEIKEVTKNNGVILQGLVIRDAYALDRYSPVLVSILILSP